MSKMQLLAHLPDGSTWADPAKPSASCRFKTTKSAKTVDGVRLENYVTEIIYTDQNAVKPGELAANDSISVRFRVSGSLESMARIQAVLASVASQIPAWNKENVLTGFEPITAPVNPGTL